LTIGPALPRIVKETLVTPVDRDSLKGAEALEARNIGMTQHNIAGATIDLRTYGVDHPAHTHEHVQLVLPLFGTLEIEIDGLGGELTTAQAACVAPNARHSQWSASNNRFCIVDCDIEAVGERALERSSKSPYFRVDARLLALLNFVRVSESLKRPLAELDGCGSLIARCFAASFSEGGQLAGLKADISASPDEPWRAREIERRVGLPRSQLQALARANDFGSVRQLVSRSRLDRAVELLADPALAITEIALACGYSEQSALTRAMRRELGVTPSAWRRQQRT
jgi:AraC-like DNA-binding protein